jgi:mannosyl-oligosaccharide glucosidase
LKHARCEQGDNLDSFGWTQHDGENFGVQEIRDRGLLFTTSFVKRLRPENAHKGGDWSARVRIEPISTGSKSKPNPKEVTLFFYLGMDENSKNYQLRPIFGGHDASQITGIVGRTDNLGDFKVDFVSQEIHKVRHTFYSSIDSPGPFKFTDGVMQRLRLYQMDKEKIIGLDFQHLKSDDPNLIVYQVIAELPFEMDIVFSPNQQESSTLKTISIYFYYDSPNATLRSAFSWKKIKIKILEKFP